MKLKIQYQDKEAVAKAPAFIHKIFPLVAIHQHKDGNFAFYEIPDEDIAKLIEHAKSQGWI
jgi:hypothetical protein